MNNKSFLIMGAILATACSSGDKIAYPETERTAVCDTLWGVPVADPYRWLENDTSEATARWVEAQNKVTHKYLEAIPFRDQLRDRLNELTSLEELSALLPAHACVVLAHPFRVRMTVMDPSPLFGIEGHNGLTEPFRNQMAMDYAARFGKPVTSGSDCHHESHAARGGIETPHLIRTPHELADVLREGSYTLYRGA